MTRLSVNVNKVATLRNARGANNPNLVEVVRDCEKYGAVDFGLGWLKIEYLFGHRRTPFV